MQLVLLGLHSTQSMILCSSLYFLRILDELISQTTRLESSSPEARNRPSGDIDTDLTQVVWNLKSTDIFTGNGLRSFGDGSSGIRAFGSAIWVFLRVILGHMYRSRHLSKCSLTRSW